MIRAAAVVLAASATLAGFASAATARSSSRCGKPSATNAAVSFPQGTTARTAVVHVPASDTGARPVPLVLNLHGSGSNADQQHLLTAMDKTADADGFVVAYPQGVIPEGSGFDWNIPGQPLVGGRKVPAGSPSDVKFVGKLLTVLERMFCIDSRRVYATGFSGGARMASQLACDIPGRIAAIAAVSGLRFPAPCPATGAIPVLAFHGTADPIDPYAGHGQDYWTYSVPDASKRWAAHDGCAARPTVSHPAASVTLTVYARCKSGAAVELYTIKGEGHEWPGGPTLPPLLEQALGPQSNAVDANAVMWKFFSAHPLR